MSENNQELTQEQQEEQEALEHQDFLNAIDGVTEEPEPEIEPEPEFEPEGENEAEAEQEEAQAPAPITEDALKALERRLDDSIGRRIGTIEGRVGKMQSDMAAAAKAAKEAGAAAPTATQVQQATTDAKRKQLEQDFPEWAGALAEMEQQIISKIPKTDNTQQLKFSEQLEAARLEGQRQAFLARQMARLDMEYPDWETVIVSDPYKNWLTQQPKEIQQLTQSEKAADALQVLAAYSQTLSPSTNKPLATNRPALQQRLASAVTPTNGRAPSRPQPKTEHEEFLAAFNGR